MEHRQGRVILVDVCEATREVLATRLRAQGYVVDTAPDAATGAHMALSAPPAAVVADLWMPSISGVQLCILLRSEPATADVPVILRGELGDPRSRFWAERAGAANYVGKGRMSDLLRALGRAIVLKPEDDFFLELSGGSDVRDRIASQLDAALFNSVIAGEVRSLADAGAFDRLFDRLSQFLSQILKYQWLALSTRGPEHFAIHHHPSNRERDLLAARAALGVTSELETVRIEDEDAIDGSGDNVLVRSLTFANVEVGRIALCPSATNDASDVLTLVARELGSPIRMTALVEESRLLAATDTLTGLMNRRAFSAGMDRELSRAHRHQHPLSFALLDVDHFKAINDKHGHAGGDQVLAALGALLHQLVRREDLVARWGGEEFVVAFSDTGPDGADCAGQRLRQAVEDLVVKNADGERIAVTVSIGVAVLLPGESADELVDRADRAMYASKTSGRNRVTVASASAPALGREVA